MHRMIVLMLSLLFTTTSKAEKPENIMVGQVNLLQAAEVRMAYDRETEEIKVLYETAEVKAAIERNRLVLTALSQRNIKGYEKVYDKHKHTLRPLAEKIANIHIEMKQTARGVTPETYQEVLNIFYRDTFVKKARPLIKAYMKASDKVLDEIERDYL